MSGFYYRVYDWLPGFLKTRINPLDDAVETFVSGAAGAGADWMVVDAGAGEGRYAPLFAANRYLGIDRGWGDEQWDYSQIDLIADLQALPLVEECADVVINTQVLEHVVEPLQALRELHRILKPGGRLFLTAPQGWPEHQQPHDYYRFTRFALARLVEQAGFESWEIDPMGGYFHYLGHRLTFVPKLLFAGKRGAVRILLFPIELTLLGLCCFLGPLLCYYLDPLDRVRESTLCYRCLAHKARR